MALTNGNFQEKQLNLDLPLVFCVFSSTLTIEKPSTLHCCVSLWMDINNPIHNCRDAQEMHEGKHCHVFDLSFPISPFCALLSENISIMLRQGLMG